jgi:hypothetical protein
MNRARHFALLVAGALAVFSLVGAVSAASASADPSLTVSSPSIAQGATLTISGSGCNVADGSATAVPVDLVNAFGDDGTIHTQDVASGNAFPDATGTWSISIQVTVSAQSGAYDLLANCMDGTMAQTRSDIFPYTTESITVGATTTTTAPTTQTTTVPIPTSSSPTPPSSSPTHTSAHPSHPTPRTSSASVEDGHHVIISACEHVASHFGFRRR